MSEFEEKCSCKEDTRGKQDEKDPKKVFLKKVMKCEDYLKVRDACHIFFETLMKMEKLNSACEEIIKKVGQQEWNLFEMGLIFSYFSALYVNCDIPESEKRKRIKETIEAFEGEMEEIMTDDDDSDNNDNK